MLISLVSVALRGHIDVRPALPPEAMVMSTVRAAAKGQVWVPWPYCGRGSGRVGAVFVVRAVARNHVDAHDPCFP